jgi:hypothetical protein
VDPLGVRQLADHAIGEAELLGLAQGSVGSSPFARRFEPLCMSTIGTTRAQEPGVDLGQLVDLVDAHPVA